jgi:hypothetical protein
MTSPIFAADGTANPLIYLFIALPTAIPVVISRLAAHSVARKVPPQSLPLVPVPQPEPNQVPAIYDDKYQYGQALAEWDLACGLYEAGERARVRGAVEKVKPNMSRAQVNVSVLFTFASVITIGNAPNIMMAGILSVSAIMIGMGVIGGFTFFEMKSRMKRARAPIELPRPFSQPLPVYQPPRQQQYYRPEPPPQAAASGDIRITSLQQAFHILGLERGRVTLQQARTAHRARMAECHPDKVTHLAREFRDLAARKALELNLAMQYIEANVRK